MTKQPKPETVAKPPESTPQSVRRVWTFTSTSRGLHQVIVPGKHSEVDGRCLEPPREANFGGDDGKRGRWTTESYDEAMAMRNQMRKKTVADQCIVEMTRDKTNGDPVMEASESDVPQSSD